jgi:catechol 2,3-dioxygenase-like lactoylglutathione lyase family enzyme
LIAARGVHHLAIQVRDLAALERFYCGTLGLRVMRRWPAATGAGERSIWVDTGDGSFLALEVTAASASAGAETGESGSDLASDPGSAFPAGLHLVALRIAAGERQAWQDHLARAGVAIYHRTSFTLYVRDPEGNRVGLSHYPEPAAPEPHSTGAGAGPA